MNVDVWAAISDKTRTRLSQATVCLVRQQGLEPRTAGLEGRCSIQLSYWRITCRGSRRACTDRLTVPINNSPSRPVGATGFEPATPCSQSRCATGLRYAPPTSDRSLGNTTFKKTQPWDTRPLERTGSKVHGSTRTVKRFGDSPRLLKQSISN